MIPIQKVVALPILLTLISCVAADKSAPTEASAPIRATNHASLRPSLIVPVSPAGPASVEEQHLTEQLLARASTSEEREFLREALQLGKQEIVVLRIDGDTVAQNMINRIQSSRKLRLQEQIMRRRGARLEQTLR